MRRRDFIPLLVGAAATWPVAARAQQPAKLPTIGFLGTPSASGWAPYVAAFTQRLAELGWIEGRTVAIEYRWADGRPERFGEIAAEFARLKVDVIVTGSFAVTAAKQATSSRIPIVFAIGADPVASGVVASLARPGGNVTGLSLQAPDLVGKRLELLREVVPGVRRLAILANIGHAAAVVELREVEGLARRLGLDVTSLEIRRTEEIAPAFDTLNGGPDALYTCSSDPLMITNRFGIGSFALKARLPTIYGEREYIAAGGLLSYGANFPALFRRGAEYVDKILRGARPANLPVEQPTKFDITINLKTAKALNLTIPTSLLSIADEVIE
jgi:putative ABC transport system substrate-binding protein